MRTTRTILVALTATATLSLLTACGGSDSESTGSTGARTETDAYNAQDVTFAQGMIPHHKGALEMAEEAADKASSAEVKSLAARIEKAQTPEIETMTGWLKTWGKDVPTSTESMPGMEAMESMEAMPEMNHGSAADDFDKAFLTMMIEHHKGAVTMATTEKAKGEYGPATSMADDVIRTQNAEITEMNGLLGSSGRN
ncbi:DUF305 domain-containing protein [Streptomyces turgidiscabies]|uniref:DUF305 domain-containing protein n=1 Tax=Streptomyces turgidiscabies (strain Car8) TaxID=698760 RepID=L7EU71_STRT8|nr:MULTISPECIES: DUF305 domain-containing protein [Streptomyces]ELP62256.1 secreted protein with unknown function, PF03713 family [Streptomyces turgidiscabies Car8]MDX3498758.1 DUF305 domain-containing protein [Streptomyces turgidiscabies]GAQ74815.1 hypothetical protein T45_06595 [Streptomyces turgidiscabies]